MNALFGDPTAVPELILTTAMRLVSTISIATIVLVALDLAWARFHWRRELRMTRAGAQGRIQAGRGRSSRQVAFAVYRARSCAKDDARGRSPRDTGRRQSYSLRRRLKYKHGEDAAPTVLAKGQDLIALKIREIAEQNNVPVVEDKMLARSMYDAVQVDRVIPAEFFRPVAEIIYFLHSRKQKTSA